MSVDREYRIRISTTTEGDPSKVAEGLHDVGKEAEKAGEHHHELHKILHLIAHEAGPEAGAALGGVATAAVGGFGIALLTFKELLETIRKLREEAAETAKHIAERAMEMRDAIAESAKGWNEFIERSHEAEDSAKELEESFKRQKAVLDNIAEAHNKILDAMEQEELAGAEGDKSKEQAIKARFEMLRQIQAGVTSEAQLQAHQKYIDQLKARQEDLDFGASVVAGDISYRQRNKPVPAGFKIDEDLENRLRVALAEAEARAQRAEAGKETGLERLQGFSLQDRREQLAAAQKAFSEYEKNRDALTRYNEQLATEQTILKQNEAARDANKEAIKNETNELTRERDKRAGQAAGDAIQRAIEISRRAGAGGAVNGTEAAFVQQLGSFVAGQNINLQSAERLFQSVAANPAKLDQTLNRVAYLLDQNNQALANWVSEIERRLQVMQRVIESKGK